MTLDEIKKEIDFTKRPFWYIKPKGAKNYEYLNDNISDMVKSLEYFEQCYNRLKPGEYDLILRNHKNQSNGQLNKHFSIDTTPSVIGSVSNTTNMGIGSTQWGIENVIAGIRETAKLDRQIDRLEAENQRLKDRIAELENTPAVSGMEQIIEKFDPYLQHLMNYHFPVQQRPAVGTLTKKGEVPANTDTSDDEDLTPEQLERLWAICQRFATVFETADFNDLLTSFEKLADKAESMPAFVKSLIV